MSIPLFARGVSHRFGGVTALDDVSLDVAPGSAVALVGESGAGKTTLLRCFNRMVEPEEGEVRVGDVSVRDQNPISLRRQLGYVQQNGGLLPHWTISQNVGLVLRMLDGRRDHPAEVAEALGLVGMQVSVVGSRYPHEISGGQRQRVALARALAARPGAILLDEPFGALDAITRWGVREAFERVRRELGVTMLLVTHDLHEAGQLADEMVVMRSGRVEQRATPTTILEAPATEYVRELVARATVSGALT